MKPLRQVVEQRLIAGRVGQVHVVRRVDDADVEVVRPDPVDEGLGEVRVVLAAQPLHQRLARILDLAQVDTSRRPAACASRRVAVAVAAAAGAGHDQFRERNRLAFGQDLAEL